MSNKESALLSIDNNKELFIDLSDDIWEHPETGFHNILQWKIIVEFWKNMVSR